MSIFDRLTNSHTHVFLKPSTTGTGYNQKYLTPLAVLRMNQTDDLPRGHCCTCSLIREARMYVSDIFAVSIFFIWLGQFLCISNMQFGCMNIVSAIAT